MARIVLVIGAVLWTLAGLVSLALAAGAADAILSLLPPLVIDADAVAGAMTAFGVGFLLLGATHGGVVLGLRREQRPAHSAGILLAAIMASGLVALAAAAVASAARDSASAPALLGGGIGAGIGAIGYALTAARLVGERRSGSAV
ncbi:MAG: hypothetical protein ACRDGD_01825 [Candidatus Limnocylindria bacterium]